MLTASEHKAAILLKQGVEKLRAESPLPPARCCAARKSGMLTRLKNKLFDAAVELREAREKHIAAQKRFDELYEKLPQNHR